VGEWGEKATGFFHQNKKIEAKPKKKKKRVLCLAPAQTRSERNGVGKKGKEKQPGVNEKRGGVGLGTNGKKGVFGG